MRRSRRRSLIKDGKEMEKNERAPLWAWGAILTLLVLVLVGWGELYAQWKARP